MENLFDDRLVADRGVFVGAFFGRLGWILSSLSVHFIELFRRLIIGLKILIFERPGRGDPPIVLNLSKIGFSKPEESRAIEFCVAADKIVSAGNKRLFILIVPRLPAVISPFDKDRRGVPVLFFSRKKTASFQNEDFFTALGEFMRERPPSGAASDDDRIVS